MGKHTLGMLLNTAQFLILLAHLFRNKYEPKARVKEVVCVSQTCRCKLDELNRFIVFSSQKGLLSCLELTSTEKVEQGNSSVNKSVHKDEQRLPSNQTGKRALENLSMPFQGSFSDRMYHLNTNALLSHFVFVSRLGLANPEVAGSTSLLALQVKQRLAFLQSPPPLSARRNKSMLTPHCVRRGKVWVTPRINSKRFGRRERVGRNALQRCGGGGVSSSLLERKPFRQQRRWHEIVGVGCTSTFDSLRTL